MPTVVLTVEGFPFSLLKLYILYTDFTSAWSAISASNLADPIFGATYSYKPKRKLRAHRYNTVTYTANTTMLNILVIANAKVIPS